MSRRSSQYAHCVREIVYGPVDSIRLGRSIGINLFPGPHKVCSFDCTYCFIKGLPSSDSPIALQNPHDVLQALDRFFNEPDTAAKAKQASFITFSGNGEPTLHPEFAEIAQHVASWQKTRAPGQKLAIFTNGTQLRRPGVAEALLLFDMVFLKLDWGTQEELDAISRPRCPVSLDHMVEDFASLVENARSHGASTQVIIQTALFPTPRADLSWQKWADFVKRIEPHEVHLYELHLVGADFVPDRLMDFPAIHRKVAELLRYDPTPVRFFCPGRFLIATSLCLAVDSIIYLPFYVAASRRLFEENGVQLTHFVSPDGDAGAVKALVDGHAQFALCDPQAAVDFLARETKRGGRQEDDDPILVLVLINKLALWAVSDAQSPQCPRDAIAAADHIITYPKGSTASYVWQWQQRKNPPKKVTAVAPGEEFRSLCSEQVATSGDVCVISADLLGVHWCTSFCRKRGLTAVAYADTIQGQRFLFTGLLARREMVKRFPHIVNRVAQAILAGVNCLDDPVFMQDHRRILRDYLVRLFERKGPEYLRLCGSRNELRRSLTASVEACLDELERLRIYARNGRSCWRDFWNALIMRSTTSRTGASITSRGLFSWVDRRAGSLWTRALIVLSWPLRHLASRRPVYLVLLGLVVAIVTVILSWVASGAEPGFSRYLSLGLAAVCGSLSAGAISAGVVSYISWRGRQL